MTRCPKGNGTEEFGDICNPGGGFALGKNAEEYEWPGQIPVTEWLAGSEQEVEKRSCRIFVFDSKCILHEDMMQTVSHKLKIPK